MHITDNIDVKDIKLTILIPTYNRLEQLKGVITKLQQQTNQNFLVVISDNHSIYELEDINSLINKELKNRCTIIRRKYNVGADINILEMFQFCRTTWAWTLSDDDIIQDDSVERILNWVQKYPMVGCFNFTIHNCFQNISSILVSSISEFIELHSNFKSYYGDLIFLSNKVYNMEVSSEFWEVAYKYIYTRLPTVIFLAKMLENNVPYMIVNERIVSYNCSSPKSWKYYEVLLASRTLSDVPFPSLEKKQRIRLLRCISFSIDYVYYLYFVEGSEDHNVPYFFDQIYHGLYKYILNYNEIILLKFVKFISSFRSGYVFLRKIFIWRYSDSKLKRIVKKIIPRSLKNI